MGLSRATTETTERGNNVSWSKSQKSSGSWVYPLQLEDTTNNAEWPVITDQHAVVNTLMNYVHTARHGPVNGLRNVATT